MEGGGGAGAILFCLERTDWPLLLAFDCLDCSLDSNGLVVADVVGSAATAAAGVVIGASMATGTGGGAVAAGRSGVVTAESSC